MNTEFIGDARRVIRNQFLEKYGDASTKDSIRKTKLSAVLVAFWHAVLTCAARCEQFAVDEATRFKEQHGLIYSPWKNRLFSAHVQELYHNRNNSLSNNMEEFLQTFLSKMGVSILFPFLWTMRFQRWFPIEHYNVNYCEQLLRKFEQLYVPVHLQRNSHVVVNDAIDITDGVARGVWHSLIYTHSPMLNNVFAFFLYAILGTEKSNAILGAHVYWDEKWRVTDVFSCAGSFILGAKNESASAKNNFPSVDIRGIQETTWIMLIVTSSSGRSRMVNCSVMSPEFDRNIFVRPLLPFFIVEKPLLSEECMSMLNNQKLLLAEMENFFIPDEVLRMLYAAYCDQEFCVTNTRYQVDEIREVQPIAHRILQMFDLITNATKNMIDIRREVESAFLQTRKTRKNLAEAEKKREQAETACKQLENIRDSSVSLFVLLFELQKFYVNG